MLVSTSVCLWLWRFGPSVSPCLGFLTSRTQMSVCPAPSPVKRESICSIKLMIIQLVSFYVVTTVLKVPNQSPWPASRHVCFMRRSSLLLLARKGPNPSILLAFLHALFSVLWGFWIYFLPLTTCCISAVKVHNFLKCFSFLQSLNMKNIFNTALL